MIESGAWTQLKTRINFFSEQAKTTNDNTPLHFAAQYDRVEAIQVCQ
jgi:hypothetical protein